MARKKSAPKKPPKTSVEKSRSDASVETRPAASDKEASSPAPTASVPDASASSDPPRPADGPPSVSRRDFLGRAGAVTAGLCGVAGLAGIVSGARSVTETRAKLPTPLGRVSDFKVNTITFIKEADLFVVRNETGFGALSATCTHLGCTVRRVDGGFACPCHGARFDEAGIPRSGPARTPLPWFSVRTDANGTLLVYRFETPDAPGPAPLSLPRSEVL